MENSTAQMLRPQTAAAPAPSSPARPFATGLCVVPEGYYVVSNTGAVYAYGPGYFGGWNGMPRNADICGIAARIVGGVTVGYWLGAYDGGVLSFGDAPFHGGLSGQRLAGYIMDIRATWTGSGYYLVGSDGGVFTFGDATFRGAPTGTVV